MNNANEENSTIATATFVTPDTAFISNFSALVGDVMYYGEVMRVDDAQEVYENATRDGHTTGLVTQDTSVYVPPGFSQFKVSLTVGPGQTATFYLTYEQMLMRYIDEYTLVLTSILTSEPAKLKYRVKLEDDSEFESFKFYDGTTDASSEVQMVSDGVNVKEFTHEKESSGGTIEVSTVRFKIKDEDVGPLIMDPSKQYFVHFFSPKNLQIMRKRVVFVIDVSGSMSGDKIVQARQAAITVVGTLLPEDLFTVQTFSSGTQWWKPELYPATQANIDDAIAWMGQNVVSGGGTNINQAVLDGLDVFSGSGSETMMSMVIFLTDGEPTEGVTGHLDIRRNIKNKNTEDVAIHCLGFGQGADMNFLRALALENGGIGWKIYTGSSAEAELANFFQTASQPLLQDLSVSYLRGSEAVPTENVAMTLTDLFTGMEVALTARLTQALASSSLTYTISGHGAAGEETYNKVIAATDSGSKSFIERAWAHLWIMHLTNQILQADLDESLDKDALIEEATLLSLDYNLVTPYTSIVVVADNAENEDFSTTGVEESRGTGVDTGIYNSGSASSLMCFGYILLLVAVFC